nr:immunoglobulin heavy chain junction region [Macaca mulatta]
CVTVCPYHYFDFW